MDADKQAQAAMSHAERLQALEQRRKEEKRMQTIKFDLTEQERKERDEYIKIHKCPF